MASLKEMTFAAAVLAAEGVRQTAKQAAFVTYGYVAANLATYNAAVAAADVAYITAVNAARNTAAISLGTVGDGGPIPTTWASLTS